MHFEVQNSCFFVPLQVWCTLKFNTCVFFVPVQVWCTLQLKPSVCFVPVEVGMTHGLLSKCLIFAGYWNCLLKGDVFPLFLVSWLGFFSK